MRWPFTHSSVSQADSSPNLGEQPEIQSASDRDSSSSPKLGEVARRAGGVCQPYFSISGLYLLLLTLLKVVEFFVVGIDAPNRGQILLNAVVYNLVVASWTVLALGILYWLVQLLSRKAATIAAAVVYGVLLLAEVGLLLYFCHNGYLLGSELVARSLSESLTAIRGSMGVVLPVVLSLVLPGAFVVLALWRAAKPSKAVWAVPVVTVLFVLLSLCFKPSHLVYHQHSSFILNKLHYLVTDSYDYLRHPSAGNGYSVSAPDYDEALLSDLLATHPEWGTPLDSTYPLERPFTPDTVLNPWFNPSPTQPNVVLILVESLGHEFMGNGTMPFVDSLAATGLYWPNCLSATTRSYGAVPALTGSVGGPRSFQFGNMPAHNSLFSLLKAAGYTTNAYYCGDFSFDCVYDYLAAQHVDHLSPLYEEFDALPMDLKPNWWGFHDDTLFARYLRDLNNVNPDTGSQFSILTTLTMHDPLKLLDTARQHAYERRASRLPLYSSSPDFAPLLPACLFTDDCLRRFFRDYSRRPDFQNTIFVITGDHASGRQEGDKLSYHRVPLILWSPLVRQPVRFGHVVTHNDIAPALYSLLTSLYGVAAHPTVHWLGDGLGPTPKTLLVVDYAHEIHDIIFHNHYYQSASRFLPEFCTTFGSDMVLQPCDDPAVLDSCRRQLQLMRYLYSYTYLADRLTAHPLTACQYSLARIVRLPGSVTCVTPDVPPATACDIQTLLPETKLLNTAGYTSVRITLEADCTVENYTSVEQQPEVYITFQGDSRHTYGENLYRLQESEGHLRLTKEFALSATLPNNLDILLRSPVDDVRWHPGTTATLSNILITLEYGK